MRTALLIFTIISLQGYAQNNYSARLSAKLEAIRQLSEFDNDVISEDTSSPEFDFPLWEPTVNYYQDDLVKSKSGVTYRAVVDSKGVNPAASPNEWSLFGEPHPYLFFRDSAKTEDLKALLVSDHSYIRTYAFGALAYRKYDGLFQLVVDNLKDTTRIAQYTGDVEYHVSPADLMLGYTIDRFSREQKDILKKMILIKYNHLYTLHEVLIFHKPIADDYSYVREIAKKEIGGKFGLVALAQYCKQEDLEIIRSGFGIHRFDKYYGGYITFFKGIEDCPKMAFKQDLMAYKMQEFEVDDYYVRALAAYKDKDCLKVLEKLVKQKSKSKNEGYTKLAIIYRALKKHHTPIYDTLIKEIESALPDKDSFELGINTLDKSAWNY